jgi:ribosome maturation protein Sdo1
MQATQTTYKFIGKVLPGGHLSLPADLAAETGQEFEVTVRPLDETYETVSRYLEGKTEKEGCFEGIVLPAEEIEKAIESAFGTTDIDEIIAQVRR